MRAASSSARDPSSAGSAGFHGENGGSSGSAVNDNAGAAGEASAGAGGGEEVAGTGGGSSSAGAGGSASGGEAAGGQAGTFSGPCGDSDGNASDGCGEALLQNSRFDVNIEHWTSTADASESWDARNARPAANSGSLRLTNTATVMSGSGFGLVAAEQCVQVTGDLNYELAVRVLVPGGQGAGQAGVNLFIFGNDDCQGTFLTALTPGTTSAVDAWTVLESQFKMPSAARSMVVRLIAVKPFAQTQLQVFFDDVLLWLD